MYWFWKLFSSVQDMSMARDNVSKSSTTASGRFLLTQEPAGPTHGMRRRGTGVQESRRPSPPTPHTPPLVPRSPTASAIVREGTAGKPPKWVPEEEHYNSHNARARGRRVEQADSDEDAGGRTALTCCYRCCCSCAAAATTTVRCVPLLILRHLGTPGAAWSWKRNEDQPMELHFLLVRLCGGWLRDKSSANNKGEKRRGEEWAMAAAEIPVKSCERNRYMFLTSAGAKAGRSGATTPYVLGPLVVTIYGRGLRPYRPIRTDQSTPTPRHLASGRVCQRHRLPIPSCNTPYGT
ncbi:uncharacterized protein LOC130454728 [Monodelphis domestica]|uniref:uncharacterized protein LOC130454728 n=1 Tax=Monodelphis domestica TaxID=13616 RepID=UPI0024E1CA98|nr:uncharacterized protein LOC130454728 [Monodelphis domestica]